MGGTKRELYRFIDRLRIQLGVKPLSQPIDTIAFCRSQKNIELVYHPFSTSGFCAAALLGEKGDTIVLNVRHSVEELNFDCGHELIHLTKHRGLGLSSFHCFDTLKPKQDPFIEWEANEGAAELTVPYRSFLPLLSDAYPQLRTWQDMDFLRYRLARRYQVTETVIAYRMESLKYEFFQYLSGTPLEDLHFLSRRELSKQGVSILSLNELEDRFTKFQEPNQSLKNTALLRQR